MWRQTQAVTARRYKTALHEAGHALVCYKHDLCKETLHKLTVVPRGPAEGVVSKLLLLDADNPGEEIKFFINIANCIAFHITADT